ncbi:hypothetical protein J4573_52080 [Actinomadura barringtoniae]|uniref:Uncharacterized protein n=1 Tax=Actinomadura barringtoniae TaxID=1427535 RepID=A0A939PMU2_9ACTN|nr:hypothetical protein [Actinomadura barringtoniae]MBO2455696.1 hypothetical protein [Actinomadura barringtoniae]
MTQRNPGRLMSEHAGIVEAPLDEVREVLLAVPTGKLHGAEIPLVIGRQDDREVVITGGPATFTAQISGVTLTIDVDREAGWVQARGQWWWCGRFQVEEHPEGALIRQQTFNLATGLTSRLVPFTVGRSHRDNGRSVFTHVLERLTELRGWKTRPLND